MTTQKEYGLLIEREIKHGTDYIIAWVTSRNEDKPYGCSTDGERSYDPAIPKHVHGLQLDGLCMHGFVSELNDGQPYIGFEPEYRSVYAVDTGKAKRMVKTLKRVNAQIAKDGAREPGDVFMSLAAALKLTFVMEHVGIRGSGWNDTQWRTMTVGEGRNRFREMIEQARVRERKRETAEG